MAEDESYGIMPYSELSSMRKKLTDLSKKGDVGNKELLMAVTNLTHHMDSMLTLFKTAAEEMKLDEQEDRSMGNQIQPLTDKVDEIIEQNKVIAEGMVALSDLVKERIPMPEDGDNSSSDQDKGPMGNGPSRMPPPPGSMPPPSFGPGGPPRSPMGPGASSSFGSPNQGPRGMPPPPGGQGGMPPPPGMSSPGGFPENSPFPPPPGMGDDMQEPPKKKGWFGKKK